MDESESEANLIRQFCDNLGMPEDVSEFMDRLETERKYVHTDCMLAGDNENAVTTNRVLRNQYVTTSHIFARDAQCNVKPKRKVGAAVDPQVASFCETLEYLLNDQAERGAYDDIIDGGIQDCLTVGIAWFKLLVHYDPDKTPLGSHRIVERDAWVSRYRMLYSEWQEDQFDEHSHQYEQMKQLAQSIRAEYAKELLVDIRENPPEESVLAADLGDGDELVSVMDTTDERVQQLRSMMEGGLLSPSELPEVSPEIRFELDTFDAEDVRWDWSITKPEKWNRCMWIATRSWMRPDDVAAQFNVDSDEMEQLRSLASGDDDESQTSSQRDEGDAETEHQTDGTLAVWEMQDKETGKVYQFIEGMDRFLDIRDMDYDQFTVFPLVLNRVSGRFLPISDLTLTRPLQDEINETRTNDRTRKKKWDPRFLAGKGLFEDGEIDQINDSEPLDIIEVQRVRDIKGSIAPLLPGTRDPSLGDVSLPMIEMDEMAGISAASRGAQGGSETATEVRAVSQNLKMQSDRRKIAVDRMITDVFTLMASYIVDIFEPDAVAMIAGPQAVWPDLGTRSELFLDTQTDIAGAASEMPDVIQEISVAKEMAQMAIALGRPINGEEIMRYLLERWDVGISIDRLFAVPPEQLAAMQALGAGQAAEGGGQAQQPEQPAPAANPAGRQPQQ